MKEFLIEEYKALTESLHLNEETGEKRLTFYITLLTGVMAAIVAILPGLDGIANPNILFAIQFLISIALIGLLVIGNITHRRMQKRNETTDRLKKDIRRIRTMMKLKYAEAGDRYMQYYSAFESRNQKRKGTSLSHVVAVLNAFVTGFTVFIILYFLMSNYGFSIIPAAISVFVIGFRLVLLLNENEKQVTHAGTVLVKKQNEQTLVLLVTSTKTGDWVLPKGHIEENETHETTAIRETLEETGYNCEIVAYINDTEPFTQKDKEIIVSYFLAFPIGSETHPAEERQKQWTEIGQAIALVNHEELRQILKETATLV